MEDAKLGDAGTQATDAARMLAGLETLQDRVKRDRRPASVPLQVLAAGVGLYALAHAVTWALDGRPFGLTIAFWALAAPIGFAVVARRYRDLEVGLGVGTERRTFRVLAVVALLSLLFFPVLALPLAVPYVLIGLVLLVVAARVRSGWLAVGAVVFGLLGSLESFLVLSNRVFDVTGAYVSWAQPVAWAVVTAATVAVAEAARRSETRR